MTDIERQIMALPTSTFGAAAIRQQQHECDDESDVCGCKFQFNCTKCGRPRTTFGESMPFLIGIGGLCEGCHYGISTSNPTPTNDAEDRYNRGGW